MWVYAQSDPKHCRRHAITCVQPRYVDANACVHAMEVHACDAAGVLHPGWGRCSPAVKVAEDLVAAMTEVEAKLVEALAAVDSVGVMVEAMGAGATVVVVTAEAALAAAALAVAVKDAEATVAVVRVAEDWVAAVRAAAKAAAERAAERRCRAT